MNQEAARIRQQMKTLRAAAVAGIIFSLLAIASLLLFRFSIPANPLFATLRHDPTFEDYLSGFVPAAVRRHSARPCSSPHTR